MACIPFIGALKLLFLGPVAQVRLVKPSPPRLRRLNHLSQILLLVGQAGTA